MTTRVTMALVLLLALLAQGWGLISVWREDPLRALAATKKKTAQAQAAVPEKNLSLQPTVSGSLPDFNEGYIFNAERNLAAGDGKDGQSRDAGKEGLDKVRYNGAIIVENNTRALLSYAAAPPGSQQKQGFLRVVVGDTVNGYMVTDILPEKIIFSRGNQKITKLLYDRTKNQGAGQSPAAPGDSKLQIPVPPRPVNAPGQNDKPRMPPEPRRDNPLPSDEKQRDNPSSRPSPEASKNTPVSGAEVLVPGVSQVTPPAQQGKAGDEKTGHETPATAGQMPGASRR